MKLTSTLAENVVNTRYETLSTEVIDKTKRQILDILGVMLPPSTLEKGCKALEEIAREGGGKPESTLVGFGGKTPCWMAAFVNGSLCHPMDYDDTIDEFPNHPSAHTFPAALAMAEKVGNISGKEFIAAVAAGVDLNIRLSMAPKGSLLEDYPWSSITCIGVFSATAASGKLLGLTDEQMVNAFGIALDRVSGITESILSPDSEIRAIRDGFGNREGVLAALMASKGITACKDAIEKFYKFFYGGNYEPALLVSNLGSEFMGLRASLKPWPSCRVTHTYVKAALDIATEHEVDPDKIEEVLLTVGRFGRDFCCTPLEAQRRPKLSINAKVSLPFTMGVVFAKRRVMIEDFSSEGIQDPRVLEIAGKVNYKFDPQLSKGAVGPGVVEVRTRDGSSLVKREDIPYGNPRNPLSDEILVAKFKDCARYAKKILSEEKVVRLVEKNLGLDKIEDIKEITEILA